MEEALVKSIVKVELHSAHSLAGIVPEGHKCGGIHGHTYKVTVEFSYMNDSTRLVIDYGDVKKLLKEYDHCFLNNKMSVSPTAENLGIHLKTRLTITFPDVNFYRITVQETENNIAIIE